MMIIKYSLALAINFQINWCKTRSNASVLRKTW
jgi:hypothetical protein